MVSLQLLIVNQTLQQNTESSQRYRKTKLRRVNSRVNKGHCFFGCAAAKDVGQKIEKIFNSVGGFAKADLSFQNMISAVK